MVTGAGGSIGSELCRQICTLRPKKLILYEISEFALYTIDQELSGQDIELVSVLGSVQDQSKLVWTMKRYAVESVYHAAAYKHVHIVEANVTSGVRNNILGTLSAAKAALKAKVSNFILISTDKAVRPTNVMGATKRFAELILQAYADDHTHGTNFSMVRFGNVLNSSGSVVPLFKRQIQNGGPVTVTHPEITRYFMTIPEAVQLVIQAGAMSKGGDVFVLDMGEPVKIAVLARTMISLMGKNIRTESTPDGDIEIEYTGLRPGEKLYEELLIGDNCVGTDHPMIIRAIENKLDLAGVTKSIERMLIASDQEDVNTVTEELQIAIPEYRPRAVDHDLKVVEFPGSR